MWGLGHCSVVHMHSTLGPKLYWSIDVLFTHQHNHNLLPQILLLSKFFDPDVTMMCMITSNDNNAGTMSSLELHLILQIINLLH